MWENAVHFEASDKEVGTVLNENMETNTCIRYSAGHVKHEYTTGTSQKLIFDFFGYQASEEPNNAGQANNGQADVEIASPEG